MRRITSLPYSALAALRANPPERLLIAPQDIRTTDATIASEIYSGYFAFAGKGVNLHGRSPFEIESPSLGWSRALNSFGWLRHLRAADTALARANARALVDDFLTAAEKSNGGVAWEPRVVVRRTLSFLSQSPIILESADRAFYRRFMRALTRAQIFLERQIAAGQVTGEERLFAAIGLAELSLCMQASGSAQRRSTRLLAEELDRQIRPDGGHISRNPNTLVRLLVDLLPLRQAYAARAVSPPPQLLNAIDRMLPMLRMLRHGDGTLALFNGMGITAPDILATLLAYDDPRAKPLFNAPHSGYQRVEAGPSLLIVDAGKAPPPEFSSLAHAGCLSFEFSVGPQRLVVNCGAPDANRTAARRAARATAAHSTLVIDDTSSCRFARQKGLEAYLGDEILAGPTQVAIERQALPMRTRLLLAHDGYRPRFKLIHERRLTLSADGMRLEGEDRLKAASEKVAPRPFALRFHIHPSVSLQVVLAGRAVLLDLPDKSRWVFSAHDHPIEIEESIFFASADGPRPCEQIVVRGHMDQAAQIAWSLRHLEEDHAERSEAEAERA
ncbi:MAG TPA: heparinase II/III family protein [Methylovirgula sp.]|nr:heparinase II/III family protein [Methylovirgula sp.]